MPWKSTRILRERPGIQSSPVPSPVPSAPFGYLRGGTNGVARSGSKVVLCRWGDKVAVGNAPAAQLVAVWLRIKSLISVMLASGILLISYLTKV